jgi:UTP--glucose-1-phosphate uridylyltransferase
VLCAEHVVGNEPFAVLLADDLIDDSKLPCLSAMVEHFNQDEETLLAVQTVLWQDVDQYGVVSIGDMALNYSPISDIIEKPSREQAPSNLAAVGRYVFTPTIFSCLKETKRDHRGEIQLTDGIRRLLSQERAHAYQFQGKRYDCGSKLGYLQATVEFALRHEEIGVAFSEYLKKAHSC